MSEENSQIPESNKDEKTEPIVRKRSDKTRVKDVASGTPRINEANAEKVAAVDAGVAAVDANEENERLKKQVLDLESKVDTLEKDLRNLRSIVLKYAIFTLLAMLVIPFVTTRN